LRAFFGSWAHGSLEAQPQMEGYNLGGIQCTNHSLQGGMAINP